MTLLINLLMLALLQTPVNVSGRVQVTAIASDITTNPDDFESGVAWVELLIDSQVIERKTAPTPFVFTWDSRMTADGAHTLSARAGDVAGNVGLSTPLPIVISNVPTDKTPPTVTITIVAVVGLSIDGKEVASKPVADLPLQYKLVVPRQTPPREVVYLLQVDAR